MILSRQTAFISALVLIGGLVLGWTFTLRTPSPSLSPLQTTELSVRLPAAMSAQAPSVSLRVTDPVDHKLTEAHVTVPTVKVATRAVQSLNSLPSAESAEAAGSVTTKPVITPAASRISGKTAAITTSGFAPLALPALSVDADAVALSTLPLPAVLAAGHTALPLDSAQKAGLEAIANDFAEKAGEPLVDGSGGGLSTFAVNAYIAATEADFLIKQRYGHRAYIQMQMEAHRASLAR
jgi:hypothetical protein